MEKYQAIRIEQNGRIFYMTAIPAAELLEMTRVDEWRETDDGDHEGYQRAPSKYRKRKIAHYLEQEDAIMPIGGLANSRSHSEDSEYGSNLKFNPVLESEGISMGTLEIPKKALPLFVVDMQHRLGGFDVAINNMDIERLRDYPLPITIADGLSLLEEVDQFDLINTTQKKVRTDLARRLKVIQAKDVDHRLRMDEEGKLWEAKGPVIASILNKSEGVWQERIMPPNSSKKDFPNAMVKETSFVTSLKPILQTPFFSRLKEEHAAEYIRRYWEAISSLFPKAIRFPGDYVLMKTPGVFSLHMIAPEVFELARDSAGTNISVDNLKSIMAGIGEEFEDDFWHRESEDGAALYGSMKGFKILSTKLRDKLPSLDVEI